MIAANVTPGTWTYDLVANGVPQWFQVDYPAGSTAADRAKLDAETLKKANATSGTNFATWDEYKNYRNDQFKKNFGSTSPAGASSAAPPTTSSFGATPAPNYSSLTGAQDPTKMVNGYIDNLNSLYRTDPFRFNKSAWEQAQGQFNSGTNSLIKSNLQSGSVATAMSTAQSKLDYLRATDPFRLNGAAWKQAENAMWQANRLNDMGGGMNWDQFKESAIPIPGYGINVGSSGTTNPTAGLPGKDSSTSLSEIANLGKSNAATAEIPSKYPEGTTMFLDDNGNPVYTIPAGAASINKNVLDFNGYSPMLPPSDYIWTGTTYVSPEYWKEIQAGTKQNPGVSTNPTTPTTVTPQASSANAASTAPGQIPNPYTVPDYNSLNIKMPWNQSGSSSSFRKTKNPLSSWQKLFQPLNSL